MSYAPPAELTERRQGHYAGAVSRLVAFAADIGALWGLYTLGLAGLSFASQLVTGHGFKYDDHQAVTFTVLVVWSFIYFAYQWALSGRTIGMAILGIKVVARDGTPVTTREAVVRTLTLPLSFLLFGLGFLGILIGRERRAWHDHFAGTAVVYSWDARAARLRWLAKQDPTVPTRSSRRKATAAASVTVPVAADPATADPATVEPDPA